MIVTLFAVTIPANFASPLTKIEVPEAPTAPTVSLEPVATEVPIPTSFVYTSTNRVWLAFEPTSKSPCVWVSPVVFTIPNLALAVTNCRHTLKFSID